MNFVSDEENTESLLNYTKSLHFALYLALGFNANTSDTTENKVSLVNEWL